MVIWLRDFFRSIKNVGFFLLRLYVKPNAPLPIIIQNSRYSLTTRKKVSDGAAVLNISASLLRTVFSLAANFKREKRYVPTKGRKLLPENVSCICHVTNNSDGRLRQLFIEWAKCSSFQFCDFLSWGHEFCKSGFGLFNFVPKHKRIDC